MNTVEKIMRIQENAYEFPYHLIPHYDEYGIPRFERFWTHAFIYLCYLETMEQYVRRMQPDSLLDVGCGEGCFLSRCARFVHNTVGVDISSRAVSFGRAFFPELDLRCVDVFEMNDTFDVITMLDVLEHIPDNKEIPILAKLHSLLSSQGTILIGVPTDNSPVMSKHFRHYNEALLREVLKQAQFPEDKIEIIYFMRHRRWLKYARRCLHNRLFTINSRCVRSLYWRYIKNLAITANAEDANTIIAVAKA